MSQSSVAESTRAGMGTRLMEAGAVRKKAMVDIVGCGSVVKLFHLPAVKWLEGQGLVEVRYCIDPNPLAASSVASRFSRAQPVSARSPASFDGRGASTVVVATPPEYHTEWALHYLQARAHVLVEKPAVLTTAEYALLEEAARANERAVLAAHIRRLYPSVTAAREAVRSGRIGRVTRIEAHSGLRWNWASQSDYPISSPAGGVLYDLGSHVLDVALFVSGIDDPAAGAVTAERVRIKRWPGSEPSHEMRAEFVLRGADLEIPVMAQLSRREPLANVVRVQGEQGEVLVDVWYRRTFLLRVNGAWTKLTGEAPGYTGSAQGCVVAENLELWRVWALRGHDSKLALAHFELLTRLLETLVGGE